LMLPKDAAEPTAAVLDGTVTTFDAPPAHTADVTGGRGHSSEAGADAATVIDGATDASPDAVADAVADSPADADARPCECSEGACCDGCYFRPWYYPCVLASDPNNVYPDVPFMVYAEWTTGDSRWCEYRNVFCSGTSSVCDCSNRTSSVLRTAITNIVNECPYAPSFGCQRDTQ
jgi:hypothetical protein